MPLLTHGDGSGCSVSGKAAAAERGGVRRRECGGVSRRRGARVPLLLPPKPSSSLVVGLAHLPFRAQQRRPKSPTEPAQPTRGHPRVAAASKRQPLNPPAAPRGRLSGLPRSGRRRRPRTSGHRKVKPSSAAIAWPFPPLHGRIYLPFSSKKLPAVLFLFAFGLMRVGAARVII